MSTFNNNIVFDFKFYDISRKAEIPSNQWLTFHATKHIILNNDYEH